MSKHPKTPSVNHDVHLKLTCQFYFNFTLGIERQDGIFKVTKNKYQLRVLYKAKMHLTVRVQLVKLHRQK